MESANPDIKKYPLTSQAPDIETSCLIVGAGPAGLGPLVAAATSEKLQELLRAGVTIVESGASVGGGQIGRYTITSDSAAEAFLDAVSEAKYSRLAALRHHPLAEIIRMRTGQAISLKKAASFLRLVGEAVCGMVRESQRGHVLTEHRVLHTQQMSDGGWSTCVRDEKLGALRRIRSRSVIIATGAEQPLSRLYAERVAGEPLLPKYAGKVLQSGYVLTAGGLRQVRNELEKHTEPKVAIIGGSASAGAVAKILLGSKVQIAFANDGVTLMHRRPLRIFYPSAASALEDGYTDFGSDDICPISGRVYRLAGFRLDSRELMMRALCVGGRAQEPRLKLHCLTNGTRAEASRILGEAHIIVAAMGYRPRALTVMGVDGNEIALRCATDHMTAMVGRSSNVIDNRGRPIEGLYGIGLASGFVPSGRFGGEPSFRGQANSLWLWQHDIGEQIVNAVLQDAKSTKSSNLKIFHRLTVETHREQEGVA